MTGGGEDVGEEDELLGYLKYALNKNGNMYEKHVFPCILKKIYFPQHLI